MKKLLSFVLLCSLFFQVSYAQRLKKFIHPDTLISKGVQAFDNEKYDEAIGLLDKVSPNYLPHYKSALYEKAYCYSALKKYDSTVFYINKLLTIDNELYTDKYQAYTILGSAYDDMNNTTKAIEVYDMGLKEFPNSKILLFNKGITLEKAKRYDEAMECYKKVIDIDPFHYGSNLGIARINEKTGNFAQALMAYSFILMSEAENTRAISVLQHAQEVITAKYEGPEIELKQENNGDNFEEINKLLVSQLALQDKYKIESKLNDPIFKQIHLLYTWLQNYKPTNGFFDKYYVPYLKELYTKKHFESFTYYTLISTEHKPTTDIINKNISAIKKMIEWHKNDGLTLLYTRNRVINNQSYLCECSTTNDGKNIYCFEQKENNKTGVYAIYYPNGNLYYTGQLSNGKSEGEWSYYYADGKLMKKIQFKDDIKEGAFKHYAHNGNPIELSSFKSDSAVGKAQFFYESGSLKTEGVFENNKQHGIWNYYYETGAIKSKIGYNMGKYDGDFVMYFEDGKTIRQTIKYKDGKIEGDVLEYYTNGNLKSKQYFKNDKIEGESITYFANGNVEQKTKYANGKMIDKSYEYLPDGELSQISILNENGDITEIQDYDYNGKLFMINYLKNDLIYKRSIFDKQGNEKSEKIGKNASYMLNWYDSEIIRVEGNYVKGKRNGIWKWYFYNGILETESNYKNGKLNGETKNYYDNGKLLSVLNYNEGELSGKATYYYADGTIKSETWYENGNLQGEAYYYSVDGILNQIRYFIDDEETGVLSAYDSDGKLSQKDFNANGFITHTILYNTDGNIEKTINYKLGFQNINYSPASYSYFKYENPELNGVQHGKINVEPYEGYTLKKVEKINGKEHGMHTNDYVNGNLKSERNFIFGQEWGTSTEYYINGNIFTKSDHTNGKLDGKYLRYYPNNQLFKEVQYCQNQENGMSKTYGINGELLCIEKINFGKIEYAIVNNNKGELLDTIISKNANIHIIAKYKNGKIGIEDKVEKGFSIGSYKVYSPEGKLMYEAKYNDINQVIERDMYYPNGQLYYEAKFKNDTEHGEWKYYNEQNKPMLFTNYRNDEIHGISKIFDLNGNITKTIQFRDSRVIHVQ